MDRLESLGNTLSQITLYDIKSMYTQAKNVVLNVSEMEAKVNEATNDDPWGASSTLMQEIAQGTFSFQHFNEIMPAIYSRFMEKEARQWRQIYKALQLLEYLIKHGSERVVDDARSHSSTIRMLRNFHYIDDKGKDEGINVRNRAKELVELLSDVEKIRTERRKAKANKNKYIGTGNDGMAFGSSSGGRYGGFGSDSLSSGGGGYDRDPGNYGGNSSSSYSGGYNGGSSVSNFREEPRRGANFEEYNAGDDEISSPRRSNSLSISRQTPQPRAVAKAKEPAPPAPVQEVDLLGGLDEDISPSSGGNGFGAFATNKALPVVSSPPAVNTNISLDDDDFADFQAAPVSPPAASSQLPHARASSKPNLMEMLQSSQSSAPVAKPAAPAAFAGSGYGGMNRTQQSAMSPMAQQAFFNSGNAGGRSSAPMTPTSPSSIRAVNSTGSVPSMGSTSTSKPASGFDDLWNLSLGSSNVAKPAGPGAKSINDLQKEKSMAGLWGSKSAGGASKSAAASDPFGAFGSSAAPSGGDDDLLL